MRKNIYDILKNRGFSIDQEYDRLYRLFHENDTLSALTRAYSVRSFADHHFRRFDNRFIRRCLTLQEFNKVHGFSFPPISPTFNGLTLDILVSYMEYLYNILFQIQVVCSEFRVQYLQDGNRHINFMVSSIESIADEIGYTKVSKECVFIFVNAHPEAVSVAETLEESLAIKVFEYNHHRLRGDLDAKLSILKYLADDIEPNRKTLDGLNKTLSSNLFQMFHKFVRHNNDDNPVISAMNENEIEKWYDDIYQMWLLAKMTLENAPRAKEISILLGKINAGQN